MESRPIVVFDSGFGGISVLKRLVARMPNEDYVYFGDSANAPYGVRKTEQIQALTTAAISQACRDIEPKAIVIACNTATAAAIEIVRKQYPDTPVVGILPAVEAACSPESTKNVLVLATESTIRSEAFCRLCACKDPQNKVTAVPAPAIVTYVENGFADREGLVNTLREQFSACGDRKFDSVVLGCTHFPFAAEEIEEALGYSVRFYDAGVDTARQTEETLISRGMRSTKADRGSIQMLSSLQKQAALDQMWKLLDAHLVC